MRFNAFTVSGYTGRMSLNQANKTLHMKIDADIQILIGSNGSGKSSLMNLLQLCIPKGVDFEPNGFVSHEIEHNGKQYFLHVSFKTTSGSFSFKELRDDEWVELNKSMNITTQKELIALTFGITSDVQALLSGKETFVKMGGERRRQWFVNMSQTNYDYAIGVFMRMKDAHRDVHGFIKRSKEHLTKLQADRLADADVTTLLEKQKMLQNDIVTLLKHSSPGRQDKQLIVGKVRNLLADVSKITLVKYAEVNTPLEHYDQYSLDAAIAGLTDSIDQNSQRSQRLFGTWQDLSNNLKAVTDVGAENAQSLKDERERLSKSLTGLLSGLKYKLVVSDAKSAYELYRKNKQDLLSAIFAMPGNPDEKYSASKLNVIVSRLDATEQSSRSMRSMLANLDAEIAVEDKVMSEHQTTCPKCEHRYIHGFNPKDHEEKVTRAGKMRADIALQDECADDLIAKKFEFELYREALFALRSRVSKLSSIAGFDTLLWNVPQFYEYPANSAVLVNDVENELEVMSLIESTQVRLSAVEADLLILGKLSDNDLAHYQKRLDEYSLQLETMTSETNRHHAKLAELGTFRKAVTALQSANLTVQEKLAQINDLYMAYLHELYNEGVDSMRATASSELALVDNILLKNKMAMSNIEMLEKEIARSAIDERLHKVLLDELSPTTGLIAEGMVGFINDFIGAMNTLIKKVWSYPMELKPIQMQEDSIDLDYKFPFVVGDDLTPKGDVSEGSSGMLEMFNLVFVITSLRCLKLLDMPLFLDEFGSTFDKLHRVNSSHAIKTIMEELPFTQLFMISHYHSSYGSFANSQTTVLCDKNIS